jgi:pyruvate,water dikinase
LPGTAGFDAALTAFTARWGETVDLHLQDMPTWAENPAPVVAMILSYATQDDSRSPIVAEEAAAARRRLLEHELHVRAGEDDAFKSLVEQLPVAQQMIVVSEDHNVLCDQRLIAASRARWMAVGRHLRERSQLESPDDVFYHTADELFDVLEDGFILAPETIRERRRLQAAYRAAVPPARLGAGAETGIRARAQVVHGKGSSPGRYEGVARVARTLEEASNLEPGEVLVCGMTSPSWTPLFGVAGAIVTNAGGELSHAAIVAREFGIPAVTGTNTGTHDIPSGAVVVVDGDAGTVEIIG